MKEASEYDSTKTYAVGDYCIYRGFVYVCITAIQTAEAFNNSKWQLVVNSGPFDAKIESQSSYDRLYSPTDISDMFSGLIVDGIFFNYGGMFGTYKDQNSARRIITKTGQAWFNGIYVVNDNDIAFTIPDNTGNTDLYYAVVIEINFITRLSDVKLIETNSSTNLYLDSADPTLVKRYLVAKIKSRKNKDVIYDGDIWNAAGFETRFFAFLLTDMYITDTYNSYKDQYDNYISKFETWFSEVYSMLGYGDDAYDHLYNAITTMLKENPYIDRLLPRLDMYIKEFTGDGTTSTFTITSSDIALSNASSIIISSARVNDVKQDYTIDSITNSVTFNTPPANGTTIKVRWIPVYNDEIYPEFSYSVWFSEET